MISWSYGFFEFCWRICNRLVLFVFLQVFVAGCVSSGHSQKEELVGNQLVEGRGWANAGVQVEVRWRVSEFASQFWIIDQLSRWDERVISPEYRRYFEIKGEIDAKDLAMLEAYAQVR